MKKIFLAAFAACFFMAAVGVEKAPDALKVVFYCDQGVGIDLVGRLMDDCPEFIVTFANGKEIGEGALNGADMVVHSGGSGESQFFGLGEKGVAAEREFIKKGGLYHGTCAGAFLVLEETRRKRNQMVPFKPDDPELYRGGATVELEFTEAGLAAMGQKGSRMLRYHGGPAMIPGKPVEGADMKVFAYYGKKMEKIEKPKADVRGMAGKAAIIAGTFGKGKIFICGPHPESGRSTQDIFYKGLEWLTGRQLHPSPKKRIAGAPNVYAAMGRNTPEGARMLQKVWYSSDYNRVHSSSKSDVALLIDPKKKNFKTIKDFKGPVVILSTHADTAAEIKASGRKDLIVVSSSVDATAKLKENLAKLKAGKTKRAHAAPIPQSGELVLFDAASADAVRVSAQDGAAFSLANGLLIVTTKPSNSYPGVCIDGAWDLSRYGRIEVEFVNGGINGQYTLRLLNPNGNPGKQIGSRVFKLPIRDEEHAVLGTNMTAQNPGLNVIAERLKPLRVWALPYAAGVPYEAYKGRHSAPQAGIGQLNPKDVVQVAVYINQPKLPHTWSVKRIVAKEEAKPLATGIAQEWTKLSEKEFFPFLDKYGQFRHKDWPDKVHSDADFAVQRAKEEKDLAAHPGPKGWDKWGGWADGPQLPKTGGFSTTKWNGKWWIVDPDGHLWWSHGPVRVLPSSAMTPLATPAGDRSGWFAELPKRDDPVFGAFYETRDELLWPYYGKRGIDKVYDFSAANIRRKYGEKWFETWADLAHRRLRSWSCNTIANSSDKRICLMDRTPYTERFEIHARPIAGHKGGWWEFCDPFDPSFRAEARRMTEVYKAEIDDPWCFGFFVDNEHHWGAAHSFGVSTLKSPADQPCKAVFRDRLKAKYGTIAKLNAAWGMSYKDWDDFLRVMKEPKSFKGAKADLEAFSSEIAENYFRIIREELKRANPGKLYLGCRWAQTAPAFTVKAAAKYCDVLSYNVYRKEMSQFKLPEGIDAPVMIGEFHFGALDRGPFCPGLILLRDQKHRAETYKEYVRTSLEHPQIVGVHWHQFSDQATSGRFDGENMQVGWTDVCDTPYWDTIEAVREIGAKLYEIRCGH